MTIYQIKDWNIHFENDRSRDRDRCSWASVPNKQHGMGFSYLMAEKDGSAIYGIWIMMIAACSQQRRPRNGWLTSNGEPDGTPWGADDLALKFRRPKAEITRAIAVLSSPKIGWLIVRQTVDNQDFPRGHGEVPADSPPTPQEGKGKEGKGKEGEGMEVEGNPLNPPDGGIKKGPLQLRAERLMHRRPETPLTAAESRAFKKNRPAIEATTEDEWVALENFYSAPQKQTFARRDLSTLLNNWNGEIDRAKAWLKNPTPRSQVPLTDQLKALEALIAEHPCNPESIARTGNETDAQREEYRKLKADRDAVKRLIASGGHQ